MRKRETEDNVPTGLLIVAVSPISTLSHIGYAYRLYYTYVHNTYTVLIPFTPCARELLSHYSQSESASGVVGR